MQIEVQDEEAKVAAFLAEYGATKLPAACAARTQGSPSQGDRDALWDRFLAQEAESEKKRKRKAKPSKPYFPDPDLVEAAKKLGPAYSEEERVIATSSVVTMMRAIILLGGTFVVVSDKLNDNKIRNASGHEWTAGYAGKFWNKFGRDAQVQA